MKTYELSGIIQFEYDRSTQIKLIQKDGYKIDLVSRFQEMANSFPVHKCQMNYWISDTPKTKDEIIEGLLKKVHGAIDADYGSDVYSGSSLTGSWSEHYTTLKVGGHNLLDEMRQYENKFIIIELNIATPTHK